MVVMKMMKLRLLNTLAPAYFFTATAATFALFFLFFLPTIFQPPAAMANALLFLFLMGNALGNYTLTILDSCESPGESVLSPPAALPCPQFCPEQLDARYLRNDRHFCKLCAKVIVKRDHHCFFTGNCIGSSNMRYFLMFCIYTSSTCFYCLVLGVAYLMLEYAVSFANPLAFLTLLPLTVAYFFMGVLPGPQVFLVLMLYVWMGIGLVCAGFCCQQVLLVARGQTWCQRAGAGLSGLSNQGMWKANLAHVFGSRWALGLLLPVHTIKEVTAHEENQSHKND